MTVETLGVSSLQASGKNGWLFDNTDHLADEAVHNDAVSALRSLQCDGRQAGGWVARRTVKTDARFQNRGGAD